MKLPIKDFAAFIFAAHCALALYADEGDVVMDGFGEGTKYTLSENLGKISEDGSTLEIDCSKHGGTEFNHILITRRGLLKPDTFYTIKFKVLIPEESESKYLHTFVRNSENYDPATDLGHLNASFTFGKYAPKKLVFKTGSDADKFSYFITTHGKAAASIKDFSIVEGNGEGFVSIDENPEPYKIKRNRLPKGAKEFSVELPNNPDGAVLKASDFGIKAGEKDLVKKINNLLEHCKKTGASKLVFDKGVYHITESEAIQLVDLKDFEFDGGGSTFVYDKNGGNVNMYIRSCERIKVGNFNFDWDWEKDPLASVVEVVGVKNDAEEGYVDYKFVEYDKFPRKNLRVANLSCYDPKTKSVGHEGGFGISYEFFAGQNVPKVEWLSDNVLRVYSDSGRIRRVKPGLMFRMQHYYYDMGGFVLDSNRHLTLKDVNIWSCKGHALVITGTQKYTHFYNVNIVRPPNSERRAITCTADHLHIGRSQGFLKLENCEFSLGADDCINMHDTSNFCVKISDTVVQTKNSDAFPIGTKVEFRQGDYSPAKYIATVIGSRKVEGQNRSYEMEFDKPLPEQLFDGFIMFNLDYDTRNVIVRNCYFHDNRARGILILARDVTIENCKFRHNEMGAIKIETGYTFDVWSEGYGVDNVVIRNNTFDTSNPLDVENAGRARDIVMSVYMKTDPSLEQTTYPILKDILVESNTMRDTFGLIAFIASTGNVTFLNNTFINETPRNKPLEYRGEFFVTHSKRTRIVNNTWVKSPHVKTPGVIYDKETVKGLIVKGNKVVDKVEQ